MDSFRKWGAAFVALTLLVAGTVGVEYARSQAGQGTLTSLLATYYVPIQVPASALNNNTSLATLKTYVQSGGTPGAGVFTTVTANDIAGGDASLAVDGLAAAQGGAIAIKGGTSSTTGNAGGAVTVTGGTPGATGVGGAATLASGPGGSTSGAAGAVAITAGTATSANGASVTVTAGAGAGGTNAGGSVNLVPGAAVSTGDPGTVQVNGNASLMCGSYYFTGTPAATNQVFYVATRPLLLATISQIHSVAAGGTSTLDVTKDTSTNAPAAGTALTSAAFNLNATANTVQAGAVTATVATKTFSAGDRLAVKFNNAIQSSAGVVVTACFAPL